MKKRNGFVSNSSSSSFVVYKKDLTGEQIDKINNHIEEGKKLAMHAYDGDEWSITDYDGALELSTGMDNFDMTKFLDLIGVDPDKIDWRY